VENNIGFFHRVFILKSLFHNMIMFSTEISTEISTEKGCFSTSAFVLFKNLHDFVVKIYIWILGIL
jgi:hypothetical protein